jgi:hypothetical protein
MSSLKGCIRRKSQSFLKSLQCLSPGNVSYGTMTNAFHMAMCHTVPRLVPFTWQCVIRYHNQCNMIFFSNVVSQKLYPEKITELSQITEKVHLVRTWSRTFSLCAMWKALVVVPYDTLQGERHWSWYRMTYSHVKYTGCVTVWRIVMLTVDISTKLFLCRLNGETW